MNPWPPHHYRRQAAAAGVDPEVAGRALDQARRLQEAGLPAILTLKHLSLLTGVPYKTLRKIVERALPEPYRFFRVTKRSGGYRLICVPHPALFRVQKWIARYILRQVKVHPASRAYGPGQSVVKCAAEHCGCKWLVKVDLRQFFESISERQVYHSFHALGYQPLVSFELARICTRVAEHAPRRYRKSRWRNVTDPHHLPVILPYRFPIVGHLPQGAPTSPMLSNLAMLGFDKCMTSRASAAALAYTRYSDDLIFSTADAGFTRARTESFIRSVHEDMLPFGLRPHTAKTVIAPPGARKIVLGLLVDRDRPRLTREFRANLEQHVYYLSEHGPAIHAHRRGFRSIFSLQQFVTGLLNYASQVDPAFAAPLWDKFRAIDWPY